MNDNTLKIRIQIQQPQQAIEQIYPDLPEPEITYEHVLDWRKISIAALLLLSILVLVGYFLFKTDTNEVTTSAIDPATSVQDSAASSGKIALTPAIADPTIKVAPNPPVSEPTAPSDLVQPKSSGPSEAIVAPIKETSAPIAKPKPTPIANRPTVTPKRKPQPVMSPEPKKISDHPQVLKAQLSHAIKAREPVDAIDAIQLRQDESKPIYFYLQLKDMQGKKVSILWYHNDHLDSQLPLEIRNNNWRTNASKHLDHQRLGAWRVELVDESGNLLASKNFTVTMQ